MAMPAALLQPLLQPLLRPLHRLLNAFRLLRRRLHERFVRWALRVPTPEPAPVVLSQRRVYVLPTRGGLAFGTALITIFLGAVNYNLSLGHALVFLLAGLGLVTILHTFRNLVQLRIRPGRCDPAFAGGHASFELLLENPRQHARTCVRLNFPDMPPSEIDVPAHATATATLTLPAPRRGWLTPPRITLETTWPLGLVRTWAYAAPAMRCLVYPQPAAKAPPLPVGGEMALGSQSANRGSDDFSSLRPHQPADPPRHIAWKAVARQEQGPLLTKQFNDGAARQIWLDWQTAPAADVEERLSLLTRWLLDADAAGLAWGLRLPRITLQPGQGGAHRDAGLRALALFGHSGEG
jgi:uncharacterized protein (DUF58 family)